MANLLEDFKHERERGLILEILIAAGLRPMPFLLLQSQMVSQAFAIEESALDFHLQYLSDGGYVEVRNLREGRVDLQMRTVRATKRAVDLRDGRTQPDPGIRFE